MSEALRLAHELILAMRDTDEEHWDALEEAAAELRRLHALNAELVEALRDIARQQEGDEESAQAVARAALAKVAST